MDRSRWSGKARIKDDKIGRREFWARSVPGKSRRVRSVGRSERHRSGWGPKHRTDGKFLLTGAGSRIDGRPEPKRSPKRHERTDFAGSGAVSDRTPGNKVKY